MSESPSDEVERLGDKDLPFIDCERCDKSPSKIYVIRGEALCPECTLKPPEVPADE